MSLLDRFMSWIEKRGGCREIWRTENGTPKLYLKRYYIYRGKRGEWMIHQFFLSDKGPVHDHPFSSWGFILRKGYWETLVSWLDSGYNPFGTKSIWRGFLHFGYRPASSKKHDDARSYHKVTLNSEDVGKGNVITFFATGARNPFGWGFWDEVTKNFISFKTLQEREGTKEKNSSPDDYNYGWFPTKKPIIDWKGLRVR